MPERLKYLGAPARYTICNSHFFSDVELHFAFGANGEWPHYVLTGLSEEGDVH